MTYEDYLYHHGILGQKWGKKNGPPYPLEEGQKSKKEKVSEARKNYKDSIKDYKKEYKNSVKGQGILASRNLQQVSKAEEVAKKIKDAEKAVRDARIELYKEKKGGSEEALKKAYAKELSKYGLPDSYKDMVSGYKGHELINEIRMKHGEEFAESVLKKSNTRVYTDIATSMAISAGLFAVSMYLSNRDSW